MNRSAVWILAMLATALLLGGCPSKPTQPDPRAPSAAELDAMSRDGRVGRDVATAGLEDWRMSALEDPRSPLYRRVVYFEFDAATIAPQYVDLLRTHAQFLSRQPQARVVLEGHTDERGTREYNLALGDRRAEAVRRFLIAEGAPAEKIRTLSYGEERPAEPGQDERAWALNRRVELVY